ncbi:MAG: hypothetical protein NT121_11360 [Chloroflexi bacterium]|nr:hypothetical protein [Chloroflexota bacterium]
MAEKKWEVTKIRYCDHVGHEVAFETEVIYPIDFLPDAPRVTARRCSNAKECNMFDRPTCVWCGTNPNHEPL